LSDTLLYLVWPLKARPFLEQRHIAIASHAWAIEEYEIYGGREFVPRQK
jgi:hypothetical protein